jgi:uncharacterized repeat protein (TIGR02543 family)
VLPPHLNYINERTFYKCSKLKNVTIGRGTTNIGYLAFQDCTSLKSIVLPRALKEITRDAFYNCTALETVTLPKRLEEIGNRAFYGCNTLTVYYSGTDAEWEQLEANIGTEGNTALLNAERHPFTYPRDYAAVTFDSNGGEGPMAAQRAAIEETAALSANTFTRPRYKFKGWSTTKNGAVLYDNGGDILLYDDITLYAQWESTTYYTVSYYASNGAGFMQSQYINSGEPTALHTCEFVRAGYVFTGWNTSYNGSGDAYTDGETVTKTVTSSGTSIGLYAQWRKVADYAVAGAFDSNGYLLASYAAKGSALVIAVSYDADGKPVTVDSLNVSSDYYSSTNFKKQEGYTYKLFLVDRETFAPLCKAWSGRG